MTISGIIENVLPLVSGISKTTGNEWRKQEYVMKLAGNEQYPKHVCFSVMGDKIEQFGLAAGQDVDVEVDIDAREYNGRWFNSVSAWKVTLKNVQAPPTIQQHQQQGQPTQQRNYNQQPQQQGAGSPFGNKSNDLPF